MKTAAKYFRFDDAVLPSLLAWSYMFSAYIFGFAAILADALWLNVLGILFLAHAMVIAAYFVHECAHESLFKKSRHNRFFGELLLWLCGASYSDYEAIKHKHVRHHMDRADIVSFDFRTRLQRYPKLLKLIQVLEWFYIPALEIMMHALVIILPFVKESRRHLRRRVVTVLMLRLAFFALLASISWKVLLFYPVAYMLFMTVMRFMDVHQHTYDLYETLDHSSGHEVRQYDSAFEKRNTFSNLLSQKYPWLNLLVLNFSYHNVHHDRQMQPWYRLPALHRELYGKNETQVLSIVNLLKSYHRYRVQRVINSDATDTDVHKGRDFIGVDGVSFLTAH
ncbi:fatty acid desaturase family protein [Sulfurovum mangrovi]|uniref:fatty acid desaturase family protein n=1 Tax=Sulfurovum mangrovi TaxID=2893889 RepID=UPI001E5AE808|nr:fatty acid desaturase [Sulfurovum mangrovi]UFH60051.1 fatty acid desaturase [Sulfurovum mangrovi]